MCFTVVLDKLEKSPKHFFMVLLSRLIIHDSLHLLFDDGQHVYKDQGIQNSGASYLAVLPG